MISEQHEIERYNEWRKTFTGFTTNRYDIINHLIKKNDYVNYLEIGINDGDNFKRIEIEHKDGVDPNPIQDGIQCANYSVSSDDFFDLLKGHDEIKYDIIFIDGLHHWEQVEKDLLNSLNHLQSKGVIVMHDCNPMFEVTQRRYAVVGAWNGDTWKAFTKFRTTREDLEMYVVDTDHGIGVVKIGNQKLYTPTILDMDYSLLDNNRKELLNLITIEEFYKREK